MVPYLRGYCFAGTRSVGVVSSAPNPWRERGESLPDSDKGGGSDVLWELAEIIRDWPRQKTVTLSDEERHLRFILAVAGYPEIDVATRPFDWPLHRNSLRALSVSKTLDDLIGMHEWTSLRSSLLNRDLNYRSSEQLDKLKGVHEQCLLLLFARTRQLDEVEDEEGGPYYRAAEEALLTHLHSHDNSRRDAWWPKLEGLKDYKNVLPRDMDKPVRAKTAHEYGSDEFEQWKKKVAPGSPWQVRDELWKQYQNQEKYGSFSLQEQEAREVAFQFHYVQSWIDKVVPSDDELHGTVQRFLRGASLILELVVSEVRQRIAHEVGIGSITVDGGGRIVFLCPEYKIKKMRGQLERVSEEFLRVDKTVALARNNVRFEKTIEKWARECFDVGHKEEERKPNSRAPLLVRLLKKYDKIKRHPPRRNEDEPDRFDFDKWFGQIQSLLPSISTQTLATREDQPNSIEEVVRLLENYPSPKIVKIESKDDCWFCTGGFFEDCVDEDAKTESKNREEKANRIDSLMGLERKGKPSKKICPFHRLLYFIGHDQRLRDSTLRPPTRSNDPPRKEDGRQRMTTAIARIDGNSLGIIFQVDSRREDLSSDILLDRKRRRSFRFNSHWWQSIQQSVDRFGTGDRVAAWVTAGDDVILAQYDGVLGANEEFKRREEELLEKTLRCLAEEIKQWKDLDGEEMFLSFGAGVALKRSKSVQGSNDRILTQLHRAKHFEHLAKNRWKTRASKEWRRMLRMHDGELVEFDEDEGESGDWISETNSVMVVDREDLDAPEVGSKDPDFEKEDFENWTEGGGGID